MLQARLGNINRTSDKNTQLVLNVGIPVFTGFVPLVDRQGGYNAKNTLKDNLPVGFIVVAEIPWIQKTRIDSFQMNMNTNLKAWNNKTGWNDVLVL